jgi:hypothetical protein
MCLLSVGLQREIFRNGAPFPTLNSVSSDLHRLPMQLHQGMTQCCCAQQLLLHSFGSCSCGSFMASFDKTELPKELSCGLLSCLNWGPGSLSGRRAFHGRSLLGLVCRQARPGSNLHSKSHNHNHMFGQLGDYSPPAAPHSALVHQLANFSNTDCWRLHAGGISRSRR